MWLVYESWDRLTINGVEQTGLLGIIVGPFDSEDDARDYARLMLQRAADGFVSAVPVEAKEPPVEWAEWRAAREANGGK